MLLIQRAEKLAPLPVRAIIATLFAAFLLAPTSVHAACSHLVKSGADRVNSKELTFNLSTLVLAGDPSPVSTDNGPPSPAHKPCSGAWCTGQPGIPLVPPGVFEDRIENWACSNPLPDDRSNASDFLTTDATRFHPVGQVGFIFHPPRPSSLPA
jgi:hypothetical protein